MIFRFERFELDDARRELRRDGGRVEVQPLVLELLLYLVRHRDRVVPKDELLSALWPGAAVTDASLTRAISMARRAIDGPGREAPAIRNAARQGYRFCLEVGAEAGPVEPARAVPAPLPRIRYARSGDVHIAHQVLGSGSPDILVVQGWVWSLEHVFADPSAAAFHRQLAAWGRLIVFDKRGTGLSDRVDELPGLEQRMDDLRAVLDAAGSEKALLLGISEGGPMCMLYAATWPERTLGLVLAGGYARMLQAPDHPCGTPPPQDTALQRYIRERWGAGETFLSTAPSRRDDPAARALAARGEQLGASPGAALKLWEMNKSIDVRELLPAIHVPTLVLHTTGDRMVGVEQGRLLARSIPGARYLELPGEDHVVWTGAAGERALAEIGAFVRACAGGRGHEAETVLATVLMADLVRPAAGASEALEQGLGGSLARYRGRRIAGPPGVAAAAFDGPVRAIRCACALRDALAPKLPIRVGLHTAEIELRAGRIVGAGAEIGAGVMHAARAGEVLVSRTVRDLVHGSGVAFEPRGARSLPGVPEPWPIFAVVAPEPQIRE